MKSKTVLAICKVIVAILFVLSLLCSFVCTSIAAMFSTASVDRRLEKQGFYELSMQEIEGAVSDLQGVIGIDTAAILQTIPSETVHDILQTYTHTLTANLLDGKQETAAVSFESEALYQLVCDTITSEQYNTTAQMEKDRKEAYDDLKAAINGVLAFFPQSLFDSATEILADGGISLQTVYSGIATAKTAALPCGIVTVLLGVGLIFLYRKDKVRGVRTVAGCIFIPASVFFLTGLFMGNLNLLNRLSLSDGLLRRYILVIAETIGSGITTVATVLFIIGVCLLVASIAWQVVTNRKNACKMQESVVE